MGSWYDSVDFRALGDEDRHNILQYIISKYGRDRVQEALNVSRITMWRLLSGKSTIDDDKLKVLLSMITEDEFRGVLGARKALEVSGILRKDGTVNYPLVLELVKVIFGDEYLKNLILKYVTENFREDLRKLLGLSFAGIRLEWSDDFEGFLTERKKRRKVRDPETIKYYKSLFEKYLKGKELTEELVDYVVKHQNKWLRNVFRHYIQYLYYRRKITPETFGWIMEVVPSRSYKLDVRPYQISPEDVRKTLTYLEENHGVYYMVYRIMLESGARFEHVLEMLRSWSPRDVVVIEGIDLEMPRLVCFEDRGFCRYYLGLKGYQKPCEWLYMSRETSKLVNELAPIDVDRNSVTKYARRHGLILPKMMRKVAWRIMVQSMPREVARFVQSRFGELSVSESRYEDLLSEADNNYPKYIKRILSG